MEEVAHGGVEVDFAPKSGEQIGLRGFAIELDAGTGGNVLRQGFAQLPQFDQRGVGSAAKTCSAVPASCRKTGSCSAREAKLLEMITSSLSGWFVHLT
jgi:hypothetical protein